MSKSKSSESSSVSGSAAWRPQASAAINSVMGVFNQNQPGVQRMADMAQNQVTPALLGKFSAGVGGADQARGHYQGILSRGLGQNPHLDSMLGQMRGNVSDSVNNNFSMSGRYGSGKHTGVLAKELANNESAMRYQDYNAQMGQQDSAAQALTGASNAEAAQLLASLGVSAEVPFAGTNSLANALGALFSGGTQKSVSYAPNPIWGAVGAGLGAAGAAFSDRRLKKDIERVGEFKDGLGIYTFRYRNDPSATLFKGVMADEVKEKRPQAYIPNYRGTPFDGVNYGAL